MFDGKNFKTYKLKLSNDDIIETIGDNNKLEYDKFIEEIRESLKDIKMLCGRPS